MPDDKNSANPDDGLSLQIDHSSPSGAATPPDPVIVTPDKTDEPASSSDTVADLPSQDSQQYSKEIAEIQAAYKAESAIDNQPPKPPASQQSSFDSNQPAPAGNIPPVQPQPGQNPVQALPMQPQQAPYNPAQGLDQAPVSPAQTQTPPTSSTGSATVYTDPIQEATVTQAKTQKSKLKLALFGFSVLAIGGLFIAGYLFFFNGVKYQGYNISNDGYSYSFQFYKNSSYTILYAHNAVQANLSSPIVAVAIASPYKSDCHTKFPTTSKVVAKRALQGSTYSICQSSDKTGVFSSLRFNGVWQEIVVYSRDAVSPVNTAVAIKTIESFNTK